jgi:hypothetical protein
MMNPLTNNQTTLFIDQYGDPVWAKTAKELKEKAGGGRLFKVYVDKKSGGTVHCGYGVGRRWFNAYRPIEVPAFNSPPTD